MVRSNHLQGDQPLQRRLPCQVDDTHAAFTEHCLQLVTGYIWNGSAVKQGARQRFPIHGNRAP